MQTLTGNSLPSGLVAFRLNGSGGAREISPEELEKTEATTGPLWIHVDFSNPTGAEWLKQASHLDEVTSSAMLEDNSRPRNFQNESGVLAILRGINLNAGADAADMISIRIWVEENRVITASRRDLRSIAEIRAALAAGRGPVSPTKFFIEMVDQLRFYIGEFSENIEEKLENIEAGYLNDGKIVNRSPFRQIRQQTAHVRRYLVPQRDCLERISRISDFLFSREQQFELREQVNGFTLVLEDLDLVRERATVAQEEFLGIMAHEQNTRMLVLSIVAAIFLPLSFLTGLMGMNVAGLPGLENEWAFAILVVIMLILTGLILWIFKIKKWF